MYLNQVFLIQEQVPACALNLFAAPRQACLLLDQGFPTAEDSGRMTLPSSNGEHSGRTLGSLLKGQFHNDY